MITCHFSQECNHQNLSQMYFPEPTGLMAWQILREVSQRISQGGIVVRRTTSRYTGDIDERNLLSFKSIDLNLPFFLCFGNRRVFCSVSSKWCRLSFRQWRVASWDIHCRWQVNILLFASKWNNHMHWHPHAAIKIHGPDHAIANGLILSERYTSHSQHWVFLEVPSQWISQFVRIEVLNSFFKIWSMVASWWPSCLWLLFFCIFQQAVESADLWTSSSSSNLNTPRRPPWQFLLSLRRRAHVKCIRNWLVCYEDEPLFWMSNLETNGFAQHCGFPLHSMGFQFGML